MDCTTSLETRGSGLVIGTARTIMRSWPRQAAQHAIRKVPNHPLIRQSRARKSASIAADLFSARISIAVDIWSARAVKARSAQAVITSAFGWSKTRDKRIGESRYVAYSRVLEWVIGTPLAPF